MPTLHSYTIILITFVSYSLSTRIFFKYIHLVQERFNFHSGEMYVNYDFVIILIHFITNMFYSSLNLKCR